MVLWGEGASCLPVRAGSDTMRTTVGPLSADSAARGALVVPPAMRPAGLRATPRCRESKCLGYAGACLVESARRPSDGRRALCCDDGGMPTL